MQVGAESLVLLFGALFQIPQWCSQCFGFEIADDFEAVCDLIIGPPTGDFFSLRR